MKTKKVLISAFLIATLIVLCVVCLLAYNHSPEADLTALNNLLIEKSDLTTAELNITAMTEYKDTGTKILNRSDFIMVYEAKVWAGIDIKEVKVTADDTSKVITVTIPKAKIQNAKVEPSSIKYFNEKFSLFNLNAKDDANKAQALAEESVKEEATKTGILELADKQSAVLIEGLLANSVPKGYKLEIKVVK